MERAPEQVTEIEMHHICLVICVSPAMHAELFTHFRIPGLVLFQRLEAACATSIPQDRSSVTLVEAFLCRYKPCLLQTYAQRQQRTRLIRTMAGAEMNRRIDWTTDVEWGRRGLLIAGAGFV